MRALALLLVATVAHAEGYTLVERVDDVWRRFEDRHGRVDPDGALLQLHDPLQSVEYAFDRELARPPLWMEADWVAGRDKVRFFVQSLDEFTFTNELQIEQHAPLGAGGDFGLRLDRVERREGQSTIVRVDFGADDIAGSGWFAGLSLTPRWEKEDIDLEVSAGVETAAGRIRGRLIALDPFVDLAHALAESRDAVVPRSADQRDAPLAWAVDFQSRPIAGLRGEIYAGVVLPAATDYTFADPAQAGFTRAQRAALGGALLEWHDAIPLWIGVSALHVVAKTSWTGDDPRVVDEALSELKAYAFGDLGPVRVSAEATRGVGRSDTRRPDAARDREEVRWTSVVRAHWLPGVVGLELGLMRADRAVRAGPADALEDPEHRLITRCLLRFGPEVFIALGNGWDLDAGDGIYDGGGFTLVARL